MGPNRRVSEPWIPRQKNYWSSLYSCFMNFHEADSGFKMEHWSFVLFLFCFCFLNLLLRFVCFCFLFGVSGKNFWNLSFGNSHCVPVKSLFFHNVVSYIFIKPHHTFTVKILKAVPSGMAYEVLIIADIFLRCKKILKLNGKS